MNGVHLIGRITSDLELRFTGTGVAYLNFNIAVDRPYSREIAEERKKKGQPVADFPRISVVGKLAEHVAQQAKGNLISVSGSIETSTYVKNDITQYSTTVKAKEIKFLSPKKSQSADDFVYGSFVNEDDGLEEIPF